jgi:hypothetical protein
MSGEAGQSGAMTSRITHAKFLYTTTFRYPGVYC